MNRFILGALSAVVAMALLACVQPGASGGSGGGGNSAKAVLFKINGRPVTAEELLKDSNMREAIRGYIILESLRNEAKKVGAEIDEDEYNKRLTENKRNIQDMYGVSFEEYLKQQGLTEKEFDERTRVGLLVESVATARLNITDEEIQAVWKSDKDSLISAYLNLNHLPDSERSKVTFEQVKDLARDRVKLGRGQMEQGKLMSDIIINSELELVAVDKSEKQLYEDLILNYQKEQAKQQLEQIQQQETQMDEALGLTPPAEGGEAAAGAGATAGGAAEGADAKETPEDTEGEAEEGEEAPAKPEPSANAGGGN